MKRIIGKSMLALLLFLLWGWAALAIYFSNLPHAWMRTLAAGLFALGFLIAFLFYPRRGRTTTVFLIVFAVVATGWNLIPATGEGDWWPEVAVIASAEFKGDAVLVRNIRNFDYKTENDFTVRYYDKIFDLNKVESVDFVICYWGELRAVELPFDEAREACYITDIANKFNDDPEFSVKIG